MKARLRNFATFTVLGLVLLTAGLLLPAHLRAVDSALAEKAGARTPDLTSAGKKLMKQQRLGAAQLVAQAAQQENIPGSVVLSYELNNALSKDDTAAAFWGNDKRVETIFGGPFKTADANSTLVDFAVRQENREAALAELARSQNPAVAGLLRTRSLKGTVIFAPSASAAGQAFDMAVVVYGLLLDNSRISAGLGGSISSAVSQANHGQSTVVLETALLDLTSLGERFNWDQLTTFVAQIPDVNTLHQLADNVRAANDKLPQLFSAVELSGQPEAVADYLVKFPQTGLGDLSAGLSYGQGGLQRILVSRQRVYHSYQNMPLNAGVALNQVSRFNAGWLPTDVNVALGIKFLLYLLAGFSLAVALHNILPQVEPQLQVRGFHLIRAFLFSLGFLLVVLLLSEPFLTQESQKGAFALRLFPFTVNGTVPAGFASISPNIMNPIILLTLLVFFVLQALIYISCLVKLAEIRRQNVPARMKLKLLENEEHLFDAGLYLGFVGTIVSLIIASMGLVKFSLMAAYSSTSFGIIFVVVFKIFHLRPERRKLLLEAEGQLPANETVLSSTSPQTMPS